MFPTVSNAPPPHPPRFARCCSLTWQTLVGDVHVDIAPVLLLTPKIVVADQLAAHGEAGTFLDENRRVHSTVESAWLRLVAEVCLRTRRPAHVLGAYKYQILQVAVQADADGSASRKTVCLVHGAG